MSLLEQINSYPVAGAIVLIALLIIHQITKNIKGKDNETKRSKESEKLTEQSNETVNTCARKSLEFMERFDKYLQKNDIGYLSTNIKKSVQLLEKVVESQSVHCKLLARIDNICGSIISNIESADSRITYEKMQSQANEIKNITKDIKRMVVHLTEDVK